MLVYVVKSVHKIECVCQTKELAEKVVEEYSKSVPDFWGGLVVEEYSLIENESEICSIPVYEYYYIVEEGEKKLSQPQYIWEFHPKLKKYLTPLAIYFTSTMFGEKVLQVFCTNKEECEKEIDKKIEEVLAGKLKPISEEEADKILNG